jgi:hypothetical protein
VDNSRLKSSSISPLIDGLSDHDVQFLTINNIYATTNKIPFKQKTRLINNEMITNFQTLLKKETWEFVYKVKDTNCMFNSFLCTFLNIFQASFPVKYKSTNNVINDWIAQGIRKSCKYRRSLYTFTKNNDPKYKAHYITYCRILNKVISEAEKQHYNRLIAKPNNRIKTT